MLAPTRRRTYRLHQAVDELPRAARQAMLEAVKSGGLIVGAYTDPKGICPILATHRRGARTDVGHFPSAWDEFARARRPRLASHRELEILAAMLEESLAGTDLEPLLVAQGSLTAC